MHDDDMPATTAGKNGNGYAVLSNGDVPAAGTSNSSTCNLINFNNSHSREVFDFVSRHPEGKTIAEIQDGLGYHRGLPANMKHRLEISRCCEVLAFFRYFDKRSYRFYPTGKIPTMGEPRKFGSDGLPRVTLPPWVQPTMPEYGRQ